MKLKVCGMKYLENIAEVEKLQPDYLGFIFYGKSPRYFEGEMPHIDSSIKKVGVFVDASLEYILERISEFGLDAVQLHGKESPEFCKELRLKTKSIHIIKVFSVKENFNFGELEKYEEFCDFYLFDTKGELPGGNGYQFNWMLLENYPSTKPYFLSGGIGPESMDDLKRFLENKASKYCFAIDVNSRFEVEAGLKDVKSIARFRNSIFKGNTNQI